MISDSSFGPKENKIAGAILIYFACLRIACDLDAGTCFLRQCNLRSQDQTCKMLIACVKAYW